MRVIAGKLKGRNIKVPKSKLVRPTTDRNKEAIFNYLNNQLYFDGIKALDIYAGSGALGLEMYSRGADEVHFVEQNFVIYKNLLNTLSEFRIDEFTKVFKMSAIKFANLKEHEKYDLIIADPPFFKDDIHLVSKAILENNFLTDEGIFLIERSIQTQEKDVKNFGIEPFKKLGDSLIYIYEN